jgi:NADH-quinone oxidoreductase subunit J
MGIAAALCGVGVIAYALFSFSGFTCESLSNFLTSENEITMHKIGQALMGTEKFQYLLPFEAISVLLLACIIGSIVVARKR